jgi:hypothetical protein
MSVLTRWAFRLDGHFDQMLTNMPILTRCRPLDDTNGCIFEDSMIITMVIQSLQFKNSHITIYDYLRMPDYDRCSKPTTISAVRLVGYHDGHTTVGRIRISPVRYNTQYCD